MAKFQPDGWHTITPRIIVRDPENLIAFLKTVFSAQGELQPGRPAEMRIGDSIVMVSDGGGLRESSTAFLYIYVADVDATTPERWRRMRPPWKYRPTCPMATAERWSEIRGETHGRLPPADTITRSLIPATIQSGRPARRC
jgi:hypothetical protein